MAKIIVAFMKDVLNKLSKEEISFSRMCELINEEAERIDTSCTKCDEEGWITTNLGDVMQYTLCDCDKAKTK